MLATGVMDGEGTFVGPQLVNAAKVPTSSQDSIITIAIIEGEKGLDKRTCIGISCCRFAQLLGDPRPLATLSPPLSRFNSSGRSRISSSLREWGQALVRPHRRSAWAFWPFNASAKV
jgi:hypothetical protein